MMLFVISEFVTHAEGSYVGMVFSGGLRVCLSVFPCDILKTDASRITELNE